MSKKINMKKIGLPHKKTPWHWFYHHSSKLDNTFLNVLILLSIVTVAVFVMMSIQLERKAVVACHAQAFDMAVADNGYSESLYASSFNYCLHAKGLH